MSIIDRFLAVLTPYECLGCAAEGNLLCAACIQQLTPANEQLYDSCLRSVKAAAVYGGLGKEIVAKLKFGGAEAAAWEMAALLRPLATDPEAVIVPVPTAMQRVHSRGYDQARLLARALSRQSRLSYADCIVRSGRTHQVGSSREQRLRQLQGAFRVRSNNAVYGRHVLLIDDVVTTGATLEAAAEVLHAAGAKRIEALVFCAARQQKRALL